MSVQNVALLRMAGRLVDVSGRSGQAHFSEQIDGAWNAALADVPRHLASDAALSERFNQQLARAAGQGQRATVLFALIDEGGQDTIVGEFFQNADLEQLSRLGGDNPDILRLLGRVAGFGAATEPEATGKPVIEFGLASMPVPGGEPVAGSAVVTQTHVFPGAWEGPDSPGVLRDLVRIHEALTRTGPRKSLERPGQPQIELWLASEAATKTEAAPAIAPEPAPEPPAKPVAAAPEPIPAPAQPVPVAARVPVAPVEESFEEAAPAPGPNRMLLYAGLGVVAAGLAVGAVLLTRDKSEPAPEPAPAAKVAAPARPTAQPAEPRQSAPARAASSSADTRRSSGTADGGQQPAAPQTIAPPAISVPAAAIPALPIPEPVATPVSPAEAADAAARRAAALDALNGADDEARAQEARKALLGQ